MNETADSHYKVFVFFLTKLFFFSFNQKTRFEEIQEELLKYWKLVV